MTTFDYDLFTIGAGSGGVRASRVAAAYGAKVAVAEEYRVGGTCVVRGCVPKKMLIYGAHFAEDLRDVKAFGWSVGNCAFDWKVLRHNVLRDVDRLNGLYTQTLENNNVTIIEQRATVSGPNQVTLADGSNVTAKYILIATGARAHVPGCPGHEYGITSNEAFHLDALPKRILIVGGGYIANEFAGIFNEFGTRVTIINRSNEILRGYDEELRDKLLQISLTKGIDFRGNAELCGIKMQNDGSLMVSMTNHDDLQVDCVMFAMGRVPNTEGLGLEDVGVELDERGKVGVDRFGKTSVESIYAVGDVTDRIQLTPVTIREGQAFADTVFGNNPTTVDDSYVPSAVFGHPPICGVGLTESQARNQLGSVKVYTSDFRPMKNVLAGRNERSLYKLVCDEADKVVGVHLLGLDSPEILQAAAIAVKAGLTKADFDATMAIHPTMAEELVLMR